MDALARFNTAPVSIPTRSEDIDTGLVSIWTRRLNRQRLQQGIAGIEVVVDGDLRCKIVG